VGLLGSCLRAYCKRGLLRRGHPQELLLYLLQLVQALKYDEVESSATSQLADFLITRSIQNPVLATYFYWCVGGAAAHISSQAPPHVAPLRDAGT
jgi:hypothetical protein